MLAVAHVHRTGFDVQSPVLGDVELDHAAAFPSGVPLLIASHLCAAIGVEIGVWRGQLPGHSEDADDVDGIVAVGEEDVREVEQQVEAQVEHLAVVLIGLSGDLGFPHGAGGGQACTDFG